MGQLAPPLWELDIRLEGMDGIVISERVGVLIERETGHLAPPPWELDFHLEEMVGGHLFWDTELRPLGA